SRDWSSDVCSSDLKPSRRSLFRILLSEFLCPIIKGGGYQTVFNGKIGHTFPGVFPGLIQAIHLLIALCFHRTRLCSAGRFKNMGFIGRIHSNGQMVYLGEWHTHPEPFPSPSRTDLKMIEGQFKINQLRTDFLILLIKGTRGLYFRIIDLNGFSDLSVLP